MAGLYASFAGPAVGGLLQSTTVMVIATTSAAAVTTAEVMNEGPADPMRTLATLTVLAGLFMLLATRLGFARLMRFASAYAHPSGAEDPRIRGPPSPATGEAITARQRQD